MRFILSSVAGISYQDQLEIYQAYVTRFLDQHRCTSGADCDPQFLGISFDSQKGDEPLPPQGPPEK